MREKIVDWLIRVKIWLAGFGALGLLIWLVIKIIACTFFGICIL